MHVLKTKDSRYFYACLRVKFRQQPFYLGYGSRLYALVYTCRGTIVRRPIGLHGFTFLSSRQRHCILVLRMGSIMASVAWTVPDISLRQLIIIGIWDRSDPSL